jgi:flagellar assembly factor FliW
MGPLGDIPDSAVLTFSRGLPGLEAHQFVILRPDGLEPIVLLQSVDNPDIGLPAIPCRSVIEGYEAELDEDDRAELAIAEHDGEPSLLYLAVLLMGGDSGPYCNLAAPIVINADNNRGCQLTGVNSPYATLHPLGEG